MPNTKTAKANTKLLNAWKQCKGSGGGSISINLKKGGKKGGKKCGKGGCKPDPPPPPSATPNPEPPPQPSATPNPEPEPEPEFKNCKQEQYREVIKWCESSEENLKRKIPCECDYIPPPKDCKMSEWENVGECSATTRLLFLESSSSSKFEPSSTFNRTATDLIHFKSTNDQSLQKGGGRASISISSRKGGKGGKKQTIKKPCPGIQHQKRTILKNCANPPPTTQEVECEAECTTTRPSKKKKKGFSLSINARGGGRRGGGGRKRPSSGCKSFGCAFKKARNEYLHRGGPRHFNWKGNSYHVRWKNPKESWKDIERKCTGRCRL